MNKVHGHYDNLRVTRNAPDSLIKAAYRTLSQQYHPDKMPGPDGARIMKILNNSYRVLSDPEQRRRHDAWIAQQEELATEATPRPAAAGAAAARPAPQAGPGASAAPTPKRALKMLATIYFWPLVLRLLRQIPRSIWAVGLIGATVACLPTRQVAPAAPTVASSEHADATRRRVDELLAAAPAAVPEAPGPALPAAASAPAPWLAPNGEEWPHSAGYLPGLELAATGGYSTLSIDNSSNDYDVYVKLTAAGAAPGTALRHVYIPHRRIFTMQDLAPGSYEVRYRNLSSGSVAKTEAFALEEERTDSGVRFSQVSFTLYTVQNGNTRMKYLSDDQF